MKRPTIRNKVFACLSLCLSEFGGSISVSEITRFVDEGGNLMVAGGPNLGQAIRALALQHGFEFDEPNSMVIDHVNYDTHLDDGYHTTVVATKLQLINAHLITGGDKLNPVLYKGIAMVSHKNNLLRLEVLRGASTSYSFNPTSPIDEYPAAIGEQLVMIGAVQARNNARAVFTGSMDLFSDAFLSAQVHHFAAGEASVRSGNLDLVTAISKWVLKENGVLRVKKTEHHLAGSREVPKEYTIMDDVEYAIEIEELRNGKWIPFSAKDVQLEFVRIDPFVRTTLENKVQFFQMNFEVLSAKC
ncbi:Dolichyl-diphosphooligosaccharide-protein glycosyltransferase subunit [Oesophagostomum dentatum]|uniref:Dolichyl-diphosphooligosaccharide--protein glycosyltransferase 48 kDa subunit n=1 Tax=Oesophagostomum dentatum TaxID=61180 RepID=A0A0B1SKC8_OESDE|nr:Dolichyl-diphosphooligosaccharide-protein glycosyltransferase subunit [Oesophagostomum dentatum]